MATDSGTLSQKRSLKPSARRPLAPPHIDPRSAHGQFHGVSRHVRRRQSRNDRDRSPHRRFVATNPFLTRTPERATLAALAKKETIMLRWAFVFLIFALVAGLLGFTGLAGESMSIARILFFVFLVVFAISLVYGLVTGRSPRPL